MGTLAGTEKLGSVVESFDTLEVEDYQRVYVWDESNIFSLYQDLTATISSPSDHFFGTLILETDGENAKSAKVVDGQQRLTTITLFVAALRDQIDPKKSSLPNDGTKFGVDVLAEARLFLTFGRDMNNHRLQVNRLLRKIMSKCVLPEGDEKKKLPWGNQQAVDKPTNLNLPFRKAVKYINTLVEKDLAPFAGDPDARLARIYLLLSTIKDRFRVLKVATGSIDESLEIFLTLNSRGAELQASDLARGEILKRLTHGMPDDDKIRVHQENLEEWSAIGEQVQDHETFLRHYLVSTGDVAVNKKMMLKEVTSRIDEEGDEKKSVSERARDFWRALSKAAVTYSEILNPSIKQGQRDLEMMNELLTSHRVLLLNIFNQPECANDMGKILKLTATLSFRWTLLGENAQDLETLFRKIGRSFVKTRNVEKILTQLQEAIDGLSDISPKKWEKDRDSGNHARALLYMIYVQLSGDALPHDLKDLHLEHIGPQTATKLWKQELFGDENTDDDDYQSLISSAGNLTLLDPKINIKIKNIPFAQKIEKYKDSKINLTMDIVDFTSWDKAIVDDRAKWLGEMFEVIWPKGTPKREVVSFAEWQNEKRN